MVKLGMINSMKKLILALLAALLWASAVWTADSSAYYFGFLTGGRDVAPFFDGPLRAYNFLFNGTSDRVSHTALPAANYTTAHYNLHGTELKTYGPDEYVRDAQGRILTFGAYSQLCVRSEEPALWENNGAVAVDTGEDIGPFNVATFTDAGQNYHKRKIWTSSSGSPTGVLFVVLYYQEGTSGAIRIDCANSTAGTTSTLTGYIPSLSVTNQAAGTLIKISDIEDADLNCRVLTFSINFTVKVAQALAIGVGPALSNYTNIRILGADVFNTSTWRPHVPSSGSVVSISATKYDYNAGSPRGPRLPLASMPGAVLGLQGSGPGDASGQIEWVGTPLFNAADTTEDGKIVMVNETGTLLSHTAAGEFKFADGTNTSLVDSDYIKYTEYTVKSAYGTHPTEGVNKMQTIVNGTASAVGSFDGSWGPDDYIGFGSSDFPIAHTSLKIKKRPAW